MATFLKPARFATGIVSVTPGAATTLNQDDVLTALVRHFGGDWGEVDEHDWQINDDAVEFGGRVQSEYFAHDRTRFWVITEHDRSVTTILLPQEY